MAPGCLHGNLHGMPPPNPWSLVTRPGGTQAQRADCSSLMWSYKEGTTCHFTETRGETNCWAVVGLCGNMGVTANTRAPS